ncbi:hypothetical protein [Clostridium sp. Cult2]|nr:hypothetical protein [Clostridium sp. Cult2]
MARLPDPVIEKIVVETPENIKERKKDFYSILAEAIRRRKEAENAMEK